MDQVSNDGLVVVNGKENCEKLFGRKFERPSKKIALLPYFDTLDIELDKNLQKIVNGIVATVLSGNIINVIDYFKQFSRYVKTFSLRIPKKQILNLLKFFYEAIIKKDQKVIIIKECAFGIFVIMEECRNDQFNYKDLTLDWRPLYDLYERVYHQKIRNLSLISIQSAICSLNVFYPPEEQPNIWRRLQENISIGISMRRFTEFCSIFLTVEGLSAEEHRQYGFGVWFNSLWKYYINAEMNNAWGYPIVSLFSRMVIFVPHAFDWSPYYDDIFTKVIRSMELWIRDGKSSVGDGSESTSVTQFAQFVSGAIGGPNCCLAHFERMMKCIGFSAHPLNTGNHIEQIVTFLDIFLKNLTSRVRRERFKHRRRNVPQQYYLKNEEIDKVVRLIVDPIVMLLFSPEASYKKLSTIVYHLSSLNISIVAPKLLDHIYSAIFAVNEPQRFSTTMDAVVVVIFQLVADTDHKVMAAEWIDKMEEERTGWPTFREGSQIKDYEEIITLRHHAIFILELFVNSIDVNDVGRTEAALKTLVIVFNSIPIMDFSQALKYHKYKPEEKLLCELSKRLPIIAEIAFEKMLAAINCLAVCAPKDATKNIGTMNDFETIDGTEEKVLKKAIDECVSAIFAHAGDDLSKKLLDRLFEFVSTTEFESYAATDLLSGFIASVVWICPESWKKFATFLRNRLRDVFTEDTKKLKEPPASVLYYAVLSTSLFSIVPKVIVDNETLISEILAILIDCESRQAYMAAANGLSSLLFILNQTFPSPQDTFYKTIKKPLSEWNPIEAWARRYTVLNTRMVWHVPCESSLKCMKRLFYRFVTPIMETLKKDRLERDHIRRLLHIISYAISSCKDVIKLPRSQPVITSFVPDCLPLSATPLACIRPKNFEIHTPENRNVFEELMTIIEQLMSNRNYNDPKMYEYILTICTTIIDDSISHKAEHQIQEKLIVQTYNYLSVPIYGDRVCALFGAMQAFASLDHMAVRVFNSSAPQQPTLFEIRVLRCIIRLALNDYEIVRTNAKVFIKSLIEKLFYCRDFLIDEVVEVIASPSSSTDLLKGALSAVIALGWTETTNPFIRTKLWEAVLKMKVVDEPEIRILFDLIYSSILKITNVPLNCDDDSFVTEKCEKLQSIADELIKTQDGDEWCRFVSSDGIRRQRQLLLDWHRTSRRMRHEMVDNLLRNYVNNDALHHTREKLSRTMIYRVMRESADARIVRLIVEQLNHEELEQREEAVSELVLWLKMNKPKSIRVDFKPPKEKKSCEFECGIREDNLFLAYDSQNLPDTESKWNETIFVSKPKGCCFWPSSLSIVRKAGDGPPIDASRALNDAEQVIVDWFSDEKNVQTWVMFRTHEKDLDQSGIDTNRIKIIKYVLRNFAATRKPLDNLRKCLEQNLKSKKHYNQSTAAELFAGIVAGLKHAGFRQLDEFWKSMAPRIDSFLDHVNSECVVDWTDAFEYILSNNEDQRRYWWLIERLLDGAKRTNSEHWRQSLRLNILLYQHWRFNELSNRLVAIAWSKLPFAITDTLRTGISKVFQASSGLKESNFNTSYRNVPERFVVKTSDHYIDEFVANVTRLRTKRTSLASPKSGKRAPSDARRASPISKRRRSDAEQSVAVDAVELKAKKSMIYFRALLEFLKLYYYYCYQSWTPAIIKLLPKLFEFSNEDAYELSEDAYRDVDIIQNSSSILYDYMCGLWLPKEHIDLIVNTLIETFTENKNAWRLRLGIVKFLHVIVFSNIFAMSKSSRCQKIDKMLFEAVMDESVDVRKETAKCLLFFVHCGYLKVNKERIDWIAKTINDSKESIARRHGAVLILGAVVMAFPFSLPSQIVTPLRLLGSATTKQAIVRTTITESLREFRRQHRDDWSKVTKFLGDKLTYEIENAIAPIYYA